MQKFLEGLSEEDKRKYKHLESKFRETEDLDEKKKCIPYLVILQEKGELELSKKRQQL
ncbi:hypothetical protein [Sediminibacillus massiliensis]|uniref:hypothetical protein n=1 Tax=Sediminibacillus massiliensis TaxID=1926277 RepID=UPI0015C2DC78|nr:hypothetical protein [Sediminibacillus massiliensis]